MQKTRRRFAARGQGLAEFAIVFPVFMFILAGGPWKNATGTVAYSSSTCPADNQTQVWVTVTGQFDAPIFFIWVPGNGHLTSTTEFRVEPKP
jgi:hypothetical protein